MSFQQEEVDEYVRSIRTDLASVKWTETTPTTSNLFKNVEARTFSGTGSIWSHNFIVWDENGKPRCDGSAVMLSKPLVVRYTPEIAQTVLKLLQDRGFSA
jgi:hypothetical protein